MCEYHGSLDELGHRMLLCTFYLKSQCKYTQKSDCTRLHMCKEFLIGPNLCGKEVCKYGLSHDPFDDNNLKVTRKYFGCGIPKSAVITIRNSFPRLCENYKQNNRECVNCEKIHICVPYMSGKCGRGSCFDSHNLQSVHNMKVLRRYGLERLDYRHIISNVLFSDSRILEKPSSTVASSNLQAKAENGIGVIPIKIQISSTEFNFFKESAICLQYLGNQCDLDNKCNLLHPKGFLPYIWQYRHVEDDAWVFVPTDVGRIFEEKFCDPSIDSVTTGEYRVDFVAKETTRFKGALSSGLIFLRRLSTESFAVKNEDAVGITKWQWYWEKSSNVWEEYSNGTCSGEIERSFLNNSLSSMQFTTNEFTYNLCFQAMTQKNLDERYGTVRRVKRRPQFQSLHWQKVPLSVKHSEYEEVKKNFEKSIYGVQVINIEKIFNTEYFEKYEAKKHCMINKLGEKNIDERLLYHGTAHTDVKSICAHNFDWRLCGKNASCYGQGSYFAKRALTAHMYSSKDESSINYIFLATVLVGRFTKGVYEMKRPPFLPDSDHELYDSCVDDIDNPGYFVIFERDQCYPKYLISYKKDS